MYLTSERLSVQLLTKNDFEEIHTMNSHPLVAQYNTIGIPKDLSETTKMLDKVLHNDTALAWVIRETESQEFVGEIGMNLSSEKYRKGEIHYSLHPDHWGCGYATEVIKSVINFGFTQLNLHRIEAGVATENLRSIALLERVGMTREGLCRKILPLQSGWMDNYMYAMLESDPRDY